jgi:glutamate/tyrosine decarboxylase-like PLP-dependent enzyme
MHVHAPTHTRRARRRFRSLRLWLLLRMYGTEKLQAMIRHHIALGHWLEEQVCGAAQHSCMPVALACRLAPRRAGTGSRRSAGRCCRSNTRARSRCLPQVASDPRFELAAPSRFGLTCFRLRGGSNEANKALLAAVNDSGAAAAKQATAVVAVGSGFGGCRACWLARRGCPAPL